MKKSENILGIKIEALLNLLDDTTVQLIFNLVPDINKTYVYDYKIITDVKVWKSLERMPLTTIQDGNLYIELSTGRVFKFKFQDKIYTDLLSNLNSN